MSIKSQDRYSNILTTQKIPDGRLVYNTARPRSISPTVSDIVITAGERDRADILAQSSYGSTVNWWKISAANQSVNGGIHFKPGTRISIPTNRR